MIANPPTLFDLVSARLPLFDDVPEAILERLAAGGFGRGLLTASLRARLRKAGYADLGMLALATPAELMAVRKIGSIRVDAIRDHVLGELARLAPGARAAHDRDATDRRRLDRLRAVPLERPSLAATVLARRGRAGGTCADLASRRRAEIVSDLDVSAAELDRIVVALAQVLLPERPRAPPAATVSEDREERAARERAEALQARDREWDEAAPVHAARPPEPT